MKGEKKQRWKMTLWVLYIITTSMDLLLPNKSLHCHGMEYSTNFVFIIRDKRWSIRKLKIELSVTLYD